MHRCLQLPEIIYEIIAHLPAEERASFDNFPKEAVPVRRSDLVALALVSRQLLDPALNVLWRSLESFEPLSALLVSTSLIAQYIESNSDKCSDAMVLSQLLSCADWSRYNYYASRVRYIKMSSDSDIPPVLYHALSVSSGRSALLPNVRFLYWDHFIDGPFYFLPLFTSPHLTTLVLDIDGLPDYTESAFISLFSSIRSSCPLLVELVLLNRIYETTKLRLDDDEFSFILSALPSLQSVDFSCEIFGDTWACLARMPKLRSLKSTFISDHHVSGFKEGILQPSQANFASLEHLEVVIKSYQDFARFLACLGSPREFQSLDVHFARCLTAPEVDELATKFHYYCSTSSLTYLSLTAGDSHADDLIQPFSASRLLSPFLQYQSIQHFSMRLCAVEVDNPFLSDIAAAWHGIRILDLYGSEHQPFLSSVTLGGLIPLAQQCRHLRHLTVSVMDLDRDIPAHHWRCKGRVSGIDVDLVFRADTRPSLSVDARRFMKAVFPGSKKQVMWTPGTRGP